MPVLFPRVVTGETQANRTNLGHPFGRLFIFLIISFFSVYSAEVELFSSAMKHFRQSSKMSATSEVDTASDTHGSDSQEPLIEHPLVGETVTDSSNLSSRTAESGHQRMGGRGWPRCCAISGLVVAVIGAVLALTFPLLYHAILNYELSLQPGTLQYKMWMDAPVSLYMKVYLFNVTNSHEVIEHQAKPALQQLGPYVYRERHYRVNIQPHEHNATITFQQRREWVFMPELSNGTLSDNVTTLNVPLVGAAYTLRFQPLWFKVAFNRIVKWIGSRLFITKTVKELLFDGYSDPLLDLAQKLPAGTVPPYDKFGWFYQRNNSETYDGIFNIYTGADHIAKFATMDTWNFTTQTKYYESYCGMVNGSFGEGFAPRRNRSSVSIYVTDICRSVTLDYAEDVVNSGVPSYRFVGTERVFSNASENADNWCFCSGGVCNPSGVGNSSTCRYGAPVFVSFPHYFLADPYYGNMVEGLHPEKDLHQFEIDLEPEMGTPTSVRARLQINILMQPDIDIDIVEHVQRTFLPTVWFEIAADLTPDLGKWVNIALKVPVIGTASFFAIFCLSLVSVAVSGIILVRRRSRTHPIASAATTTTTTASSSLSKESC